MIIVKNLWGAAGVGSVRRAAPSSPTRQTPPSFLWLMDDRHRAADVYFLALNLREAVIPNHAAVNWKCPSEGGKNESWEAVPNRSVSLVIYERASARPRLLFKIHSRTAEGKRAGPFQVARCPDIHII